MPAPFRPRQSLGQNFLRDPNTVRKIADALTAPPEAPVVEIGPGTGALTAELAARYPRLTALEIDERAVAHVRRRLPQVDVRHQDVLAADWAALAEELSAPLYVIGNLPYNITSPILFDLLAARAHVAEAVLMMQKEVAQRLVAAPRTKAYGAPSVLVQCWAQPALLFDVSPHVFYPRPDVTSAVVRLRFGEARASGQEHVPETEHVPGVGAPHVDDEWLRAVVRTAFGQRRKMLRNSLRTWTKDRGIAFPEGWDRRRPEALTPGEFVALARHLEARGARQQR